MMKQIQRDDLDPLSEQIKLATQLYERDTRQSERDQHRHAATAAAVEMGIPARFMEQAAVELSARQAARVKRRKRNSLGILAASVATVMGFGTWITTHKHPAAPPPPLVYDFAPSSQGQWHLDGLYGPHPDAQASVTFPQEQGHSVALIKIEHFRQQPDYAVDLETNQIPRPLTGYRTVSFRVRGEGLRQIRLFLQNREERWCSPFLTASGDWHTVRLPINQFLHQSMPLHYNPQDAPYVPPSVIGKISFKLGADANTADEHGDVAVADLKFE